MTVGSGHEPYPWLDSPSRGLILVCDDSETVRTLCTRSLNGAGWRALTANDGGDGLRLFHENQAEIDLLITDVQMPAMNGIDLFKKTRMLKPEVKVLFISSYPAVLINEDFQVSFDECTRFIQKPFGAHELVDAVKSMLK
jgi:two-component system, cell cycle sensor histidine kinase and response regulator CckA